MTIVFNLAPVISLLSTSARGITSKQLFTALKNSIPMINNDQQARAYLIKTNLVLRSLQLKLKYNYKQDRWLLTSQVTEHPRMKPLDEKLLGGSILLYLSENRKPFLLEKLLKLVDTYEQKNVIEAMESLIEQKYLKALPYNKVTLGSRMHEEVDIEAVLEKVKTSESPDSRHDLVF